MAQKSLCIPKTEELLQLKVNNETAFIYSQKNVQDGKNLTRSGRISRPGRTLAQELRW